MVDHNFKHITSRDNPIFKQLKKLAENARERTRENKTLLDGVHLIESYIAHIGEPISLVIPEGVSSLEATALMQQLEHISTVMLPTLMFKELTPVASSTGVLAVIEIPQKNYDFKTVKLALGLENIQDPGNLGGLLRTAAAAGADAVYLSKGCTDAWSPKALRGGQGAHFSLPIIENADLAELTSQFSSQLLGKSYATQMQGEPLFAQSLNTPTLFLLGNEGAGLSAELLQAASKQISIPMAAQTVESLNVAAAAAVCLFEFRRQNTDD